MLTLYQPPDAPPPRAVRVTDILHATALHFGVTVAQLRGPRRAARIVLPRQLAAWIAGRLTIQSLPGIGHAIGGRDHTTILHSCRAIDARMAADPRLREAAEAIAARLGLPPEALDAPPSPEGPPPSLVVMAAPCQARRDAVIGAAQAWVEANRAMAQASPCDRSLRGARHTLERATAALEAAVDALGRG